MFFIIFGGIFLAVSIFSLIMFLSFNVLEIWSIAFLGLFFLIGIISFLYGLFRAIRNARISIKGEDCYASVENYYETNVYINGYPVMQFEFNVYVESTHMVEKVTEKISGDPDRYPIGSYVRVKYYNHKIKVIGPVNDMDVPSYARDRIKVKETNMEVIEVDGKKYRRIE